MKIQKFNESDLNLYDKPWTRKKFEEIEILKRELKATEESLFSGLRDYLILHPQIQDNPNIKLSEETYVFGYEFSKYSSTKLYISYRPEEDDFEDFDAYLDDKGLEDFLVFLKDPDLYKNSKKYNL